MESIICGRNGIEKTVEFSFVRITDIADLHGVVPCVRTRFPQVCAAAKLRHRGFVGERPEKPSAPVGDIERRQHSLLLGSALARRPNTWKTQGQGHEEVLKILLLYFLYFFLLF